MRKKIIGLAVIAIIIFLGTALLSGQEKASDPLLTLERIFDKQEFTPERFGPASQPGSHSYQLSPSCEWTIHTYSTFDNPPLTHFVGLPKHNVVRILAANKELMAKVNALSRRPTEFFRVDIGDGAQKMLDRN